MNYELVKSEIYKSNNDKSGSLDIDYKPADIFDAGDIVRALLKHTSDVSVEWEDNGDCGMKDGGCYKGQEFDYQGLGIMREAFWKIEAVYNGTTMHFYTYSDQQITSDTVSASVFFENMEEISEAQLKELQDVTIPRLLGWIEDMSDDKIKFLLFNRRIVGKFDNNMVYERNIKDHTWEYSSYYTHKYLYTNDMVEEEIDYDEDKEEILSLRRAEGTWTTEDTIESCNPSPQVIRFFERTGITYADIYGSFGKKGAVQTKQSVEMLFDSFPDQLAGAPGYTPIKPYTSEMLEKWKNYLSNEHECPREWCENQYGKYYFRNDISMKMYVFQIPLEPKQYWFLTIFVSYDNPSNELKVKKYSLDYEDAEDSHYEFMVTEEAICKSFGIAPDHKRMYLHEYFCEYIAGGIGGHGLLSRLSPYITAEYHFD